MWEDWEATPMAALGFKDGAVQKFVRRSKKQMVDYGKRPLPFPYRTNTITRECVF